MWFSTITSSPFNDSEIAVVDGQRLMPPGETVQRDLSAVLTDYAKRLDAGEMLEGVGLAADLEDAAEALRGQTVTP
jgi:hypothetical protein